MSEPAERVDLEPTDPSDADIDRELVRREGLYRFVQLAWHLVEPSHPFLPGRHLEVLCGFLEEASRSEGGAWVINVPPGTGKSLVVSVLWPSWVWTWEPKHRWICTSYSDLLVRRDSRRMRELVDDPWYRARWGGAVPGETARRENDWQNSAGGGRISAPAGGQILGRHADTILVDDPIKPEDARVERAELERIATWWDQTIPSRLLHPGTGRRVIVMQRLHQLDLSGRAIARGARHLVLPMRFEPSHPQRSERDWRTEEGELLWPEGRPEADVAALEDGPNALTPYAQAGQLQQRPAPEGGGIFRSEWLQHRWSKLPDKGGVWVQSWDCAFKGEDSSDPVAGGVWCAHDGYFDLVFQRRANLTFVETVEAICQVADDWPKAKTVLVEDKANGAAVMDTLRRLRPDLDIVPVEPQGGKEARAHASTRHFHAGRVRLPKGEPWVDDYVAEFATFPAGAHDDQVDQTTQALTHLTAEDDESYERMVKGMAAMIRR